MKGTEKIIAHIEADAQAQADAVLGEARQRCDELERVTRERLAALIDECRGKCSAVLSTLGDTCASVSGEMKRLDAAVSALPANFEQLRSSLDELNK